MKKLLLFSALFTVYLVAISYTAQNTIEYPDQIHVENLAGISMHPAPAPPPPYAQSVYFQYNGQNAGNKFKVQSDDGCPFYAVVNGSPITYEPTLAAEYIFGVFFKEEPGCSQTRTIRVSYDDNGTWTPYQVFVIDL